MGMQTKQGFQSFLARMSKATGKKVKKNGKKQPGKRK